MVTRLCYLKHGPSMIISFITIIITLKSINYLILDYGFNKKILVNNIDNIFIDRPGLELFKSRMKNY